MASKSLEIAFDSPFQVYDLVEFGAYVWFAGEFYPGNALYAGGAGPGLFRRPIGTSRTPALVAGSETYRFYALTVFDDKLVALGCLTAAVVGNIDAPPPDVYVFTSADGLTWTHHNMGRIETGLGSADPVSAHPGSLQDCLMEAPLRWIAGRTSAGDPCIRVSTGTSVVTWAGTAPPAVAAKGVRMHGFQVAHGTTYYSTQSRTWLEVVNGILVMHLASGASQTMQPVALRISDAPLRALEFYAPSGRLSVSQGMLLALGHGYGKWVAVASWPSNADLFARVGAVVFENLPTAATEIDVYNLPTVVLTAPTNWETWNRSDNVAAPTYSVRFAEGCAYAHERHDFSPRNAILATNPVLRVPLTDPVGPAALHAARVSWSDGAGLSPTLAAARASWTDGSGSSPSVAAARVTWRPGLTLDPTDKLVILSAAFDKPVSRVRIAFHEMSLVTAQAVKVGVRDHGAMADINDLASYDQVAVLHNHRLNQPATTVDIAIIVPAGDTIGSVSVIGHVEE